ncbi:hypothetical protein PHISP_02352 [Aspergillus sp. HF37]|nr:hypothetical protein PHISP_02352 [Aspergillus sp. HF37]
MALSFFAGGGSASSAKYFDIRLKDDYIVFRGSEDEAASTHLRGTLVLCLSEPLAIKHLRLHLKGMSRVCWHFPSGTPAGGRKTWRDRVFYEKTWKFRDAGKGKTEILPGGNYEFPFDVILEGSLPESVEGLAETWVTYRFKAEIGRKYARDIVARKPLRIIRTLPSSALEISHAMSVDNTWPEKVEYSISTPTKAIIFGTSVRVDFKLIPLLKGLRVGQINSQLIENHELTLNPEDPDSNRHTFKISRTIIDDNYEVDEGNNMEIIDEAAEGYQFSRPLDMPKTLSRCLQDTDTRGIKVRHKLKFRIQLHNPDGHVSELRATLPVSIFISPNLAIDENNTLIDQTPQSARRAVDDLVQQAPPLYGEHQFDQLYSEVDPAGYRTPGPASGSATPFSSLSRNVSSENLASMNALTNSDISVSVLQNRLSNLHASRSGRTSPESEPHTTNGSANRRFGASGDYFGPSSVPGSPGLSRTPSDEAEQDHTQSGTATPRPQFAEVESLSRVPSYSTAVRTMVRPRDSDLPDYQAVIAGDIITPVAPRSPQQAHIRSRGHGTRSAEVSRPASVLPIRGLNQADDAEHRLRLVQARAR